MEENKLISFKKIMFELQFSGIIKSPIRISFLNEEECIKYKDILNDDYNCRYRINANKENDNNWYSIRTLPKCLWIYKGDFYKQHLGYAKRYRQLENDIFINTNFILE